MTTEKLLALISQLTLLVVIGFFLFFNRLGDPQGAIFDEAYHIPSAQKYLNGIYFQENHQPLGKLFIALGEKIWYPNDKTDQYVDTDKITDPVAMHYWGYRFFPALFGLFSVVACFFIFRQLIKDKFTAYLLTMAALLNNAFLVQSRAALFDSVLIFFILSSILLFILISKQKKISLWLIAALGIVNAGAVLTKHTGFIVLSLTVLILLKNFHRRQVKNLIKMALVWFIAFGLIYVSVWKLHYALARNILADRTYEAPKQIEEMVRGKVHYDLLTTTFLQIREAWRYTDGYNAAVPALDFCKYDEIGSPWYYWPFAGRAINYRWEIHNGLVQYIYLMANPILWYVALIGVVVGTAWTIGQLISINRSESKLNGLIPIFTALYWAYLFPFIFIKRVMYFYHYLPNVFIGLILFGLVFQEIRSIGKFRLNTKKKKILITIIFLTILAGFIFYAPLTFYQPLSNQEFNRRNLIPFWNLQNLAAQLGY